MSAEPGSLSEKIVDLEVRIAYQDRTIAALDEVVRALYTRLDKVEKDLADMRDAATAAPMITNEPPPHY